MTTGSEIDFDGDLVELKVRGKTLSVYACDEIDAITQKVDAANTQNPLPLWNNPATLIDEPGTHWRGDAFIKILREHFQEKGLEVQGNVAYAIWNALVKKADEYRDFFENGRSSPVSSASPQQVSSADAKANALLSSTQDDSARSNV